MFRHARAGRVVFLHHQHDPTLKHQCRAAGESGEIGDARDAQIHGDIPSGERRVEAQLFGYLIQIFLSHRRPLALIAPLGAAGLLVGQLPGLAGQPSMPVAHNTVKGEFKPGLAALAERAARTHKNAHHIALEAPHISLQPLIEPCIVSRLFWPQNAWSSLYWSTQQALLHYPNAVSARPQDGIKVEPRAGLHWPQTAKRWITYR